MASPSPKLVVGNWKMNGLGGGLDEAKALADALLTITDQGAYVPLVDAILAAIPSSWYTNDADYVDSWYTLAQTSSGQLNGARGNGRMTVEPYFVQQF